MIELRNDKQKAISSKKFNKLFSGIDAIHHLNFTFLNRLGAKILETNSGLKSLFFLLVRISGSA